VYVAILRKMIRGYEFYYQRDRETALSVKVYLRTRFYSLRNGNVLAELRRSWQNVTLPVSPERVRIG